MAVTLLGLLMAALQGSADVLVRAADLRTRYSTETTDLEGAARALRRLIEEMDPGTAASPSPLRAEPHALSFVTHLTSPPPAASTRAIDAALLLEGGRLVLRWRPRLHGLPLGSAPAEQSVELLGGVQSLSFSYGDAELPLGDAGSWPSDRWPTVVRIRLGVLDGRATHWPDIVIPVRREQAI